MQIEQVQQLVQGINDAKAALKLSLDFSRGEFVTVHVEKASFTELSKIKHLLDIKESPEKR